MENLVVGKIVFADKPQPGQPLPQQPKPQFCPVCNVRILPDLNGVARCSHGCPGDMNS